MRFTEAYEKKYDQQHRPSVNSYLLRVPGIHNSRRGEQVKIIQRWDSKGLAIQYMLTDFRRCLIQKQLDGINGQRLNIKTGYMPGQFNRDHKRGIEGSDAHSRS